MPETRQACDWAHETSFDQDYWDTECGEAFQFTVDGPKENKMYFCPYCGRPIAIKGKQLAEDPV